MSSAQPAPVAETPTISTLMRRGELFAAECPSRTVLQHVTSRWGVLVLVALLTGTHRFSRILSGQRERAED
ncbi:winged helix-turn-helix transcriptional regulator [Cyanobium sp. ULC082]